MDAIQDHWYLRRPYLLYWLWQEKQQPNPRPRKSIQPERGVRFCHHLKESKPCCHRALCSLTRSKECQQDHPKSSIFDFKILICIVLTSLKIGHLRAIISCYQHNRKVILSRLILDLSTHTLHQGTSCFIYSMHLMYCVKLSKSLIFHFVRYQQACYHDEYF